jgi:hypothetical protein
MLALWLPIVLSTLAIFFASFLSWMVFRLHADDWIKMPGEDKLIQTITELNVPQGNYMFPGSSSAAEMNSPEFQQKYQRGPRGVVQVLPVANMGKNLALTMLLFLVCNATFAYLASFALQSGDDFVTVFRFVSTIALLTFCASIVQHAIWFRTRITGHVIESIAYALIAGAIFAATWPAN